MFLPTLLFDKFPKRHNLVFIGQPEIMYRLSMRCHADIKSRITYSATLYKLTDDDLSRFIQSELEKVTLGMQVLTEAALDIILRHAEGNLRLCRNLVRGSLINACRDKQKQASITHVNDVLAQPHWRTHEEIIQQN